jgi:hypothetical protein
MPSHKQLMVNGVPSSLFGSGRSDKPNLQRTFPSSPIYRGELSDSILLAQYRDLVQIGPINDGGHTFGTQDMNYSKSPNLDEVRVGGGGLPGSPFAPNIASPADGADSPQSIPETGVEATETAQGGGAAFVGDGIPSPSNASRVVSSQTLGSLTLGSSAPIG